MEWAGLRNTVLALALVTALATATTASTGARVAVLPLAAADTGLPYAVLPRPSELNTMTSELRAGLTDGGVTLVPQERVANEVRAAGFDQTNPARECDLAECAQRIGQSLHADRVVFGDVTREMAVVWSTELYLLDVRSGKVTGPFNLGYKGDVQSLELGERYAGTCISRVLKKQKPCPADRGW